MFASKKKENQEKLEKLVEYYKKHFRVMEDEIDNLREVTSYLRHDRDMYKELSEKLREDYKKCSGSKGSLVVKNKKLEELINELQNEIKRLKKPLKSKIKNK